MSLRKRKGLIGFSGTPEVLIPQQTDHTRGENADQRCQTGGEPRPGAGKTLAAPLRQAEAVTFFSPTLLGLLENVDERISVELEGKGARLRSRQLWRMLSVTYSWHARLGAVKPVRIVRSLMAAPVTPGRQVLKGEGTSCTLRVELAATGRHEGLRPGLRECAEWAR